MPIGCKRKTRRFDGFPPRQIEISDEQAARLRARARELAQIAWPARSPEGERALQRLAPTIVIADEENDEGLRRGPIIAVPIEEP